MYLTLKTMRVGYLSLRLFIYMRSTTVFYILFFCVIPLYKIYISNLVVILPVFLCRIHMITHNNVLPSHWYLHIYSVPHRLAVLLISLCSTSLPAAYTPCGAPSQRPQVAARAGLLPHEPAHLSLSRVPGHQAGQEAFGTGGDAPALTSAAHVLRTGPRGPRGLAPG